MTTQPAPTRRLFVSMMVSLDGFIEGTNRELDWTPQDDPEFDQYCDEMIDSIDLALFGRRSYEMMVGYWPTAEHPPRSPNEQAFARKMNALPKIVLSRTLDHAAWANTRVERDASAIAAVKREPGKAIAVWGGAGIIASLAKLGLIDEYRVIVHPIVLGSGTPLFQDVDGRRALTLTRATTLRSGLALLYYQPA